MSSLVNLENFGAAKARYDFPPSPIPEQRNRAAEALHAAEDDDDILVWVEYKKPFVHLAIDDGEEEIRPRGVERDGPAGEFAVVRRLKRSAR